MSVTALHGIEEVSRFLAAMGCLGLCTDSRRVRPGDAFIAWPGAARDGRSFVPQALAAGAAACLVEADGVQAFEFTDPRIATLGGLKAATGPIASDFFGDPSDQLELFAVTGTNGKTSTAWWTAQALSMLGRRAGVVGTLGVGEAGGAIEPTGLTTPDPVTLQATLSAWAAQGFAACAIEASSIGLVEQRLAGTRIAVAMFSNFTRDHLDYHGTMRAYWAAKRALFSWPGLRAAVVNIDDEQGAGLADELRGGEVELWTVSRRAPSRLRAQGLRYQGADLTFEVIEAGVTVPMQCRFAGDFNVDNLLLVIAALRSRGLELAEIARVVPLLGAVPGRLQPVGSGLGQPALLIDYAHTPDALEKVLATLRPMAEARGGKLWCVFGCGGNRDATKRPLMGAIAARLADRVVLTSDNPRDEQPSAILSQILAGAAARDDVAVIEDRAQAIGRAIAVAATNDVIVIAGKGHEDYQETAGVRRPFADAAVARNALQARETAR